jgi:hypothetical protein
MTKLQAPTSKLQRSAEPQTPIGERSGFVSWNLEVLWSLDVGVWNF